MRAGHLGPLQHQLEGTRTRDLVPVLAMDGAGDPLGVLLSLHAMEDSGGDGPCVCELHLIRGVGVAYPGPHRARAQPSSLDDGVVGWDGVDSSADGEPVDAQVCRLDESVGLLGGDLEATRCDVPQAARRGVRVRLVCQGAVTQWAKDYDGFGIKAELERDRNPALTVPGVRAGRGTRQDSSSRL
ncbi:MAG TPA: hypothetical protein DIU15_01725 [Deltaproteobacteria bacterium]|nr:hypothetical protein [Deltaproteobacteria bacterium]